MLHAPLCKWERMCLLAGFHVLCGLTPDSRQKVGNMALMQSAAGQDSWIDVSWANHAFFSGRSTPLMHGRKLALKGILQGLSSCPSQGRYGQRTEKGASDLPSKCTRDGSLLQQQMSWLGASGREGRWGAACSCQDHLRVLPCSCTLE